MHPLRWKNAKLPFFCIFHGLSLCTRLVSVRIPSIWAFSDSSQWDASSCLYHKLGLHLHKWGLVILSLFWQFFARSSPGEHETLIETHISRRVSLRRAFWKKERSISTLRSRVTLKNVTFLEKRKKLKILTFFQTRFPDPRELADNTNSPSLDASSRGASFKENSDSRILHPLQKITQYMLLSTPFLSTFFVIISSGMHLRHT